jgi:hypothetical protein
VSGLFDDANSVGLQFVDLVRTRVVNGLAQLVSHRARRTRPHQGAELWDLTLVGRTTAGRSTSMCAGACSRARAAPEADRVWAHPTAFKLWVVRRALALRAERPGVRGGGPTRLYGRTGRRPITQSRTPRRKRRRR